MGGKGWGRETSREARWRRWWPEPGGQRDEVSGSDAVRLARAAGRIC